MNAKLMKNIFCPVTGIKIIVRGLAAVNFEPYNIYQRVP